MTKNNENSVNVSSYLKKWAEKQPYQRAVVYPAGKDRYGRVTYSHLTFMQLDQESDKIAASLENSGIRRCTRTILMVNYSIEFFTLMFALFKIGAVPVVVDPGMGIRRMLTCLKESRPEAFIGIPLAHALRLVYPKYFKTINTKIIVGRKWLRGSYTLKQIRKTPLKKPFKAIQTDRDELAAILFTTGSTGPAKGVMYTHGIFDSQIQHIQAHFNIKPGEIDLPTFPLFGLFDAALGMTAIIPDMDVRKPAQVNPKKIIEAIENQGVTSMFASPALLNRVGKYGRKKEIKLPTLKRVVSAGAPVSAENLEQFASMLNDDREAEIHTPYGASEAFPLTSIASHEILTDTNNYSKKGFGNCVGRPLDGIEIQLIRITDNPISQWSDDLLVTQGEIGEITVRGDLVTPGYFERSRDNALAKINDGSMLWHRTGDLGWMDKSGRLWFCGRKSHRVITKNGTIFTIPCESILNNHPGVFRSAIVGIGPRQYQIPVACIELYGNNRKPKKQLRKELLELTSDHIITKDIQTVLFHKSFPVDIRHNSKIFREKLAKWAEKRCKKF